ncbi:MAG: GNAT family N-acetyltransferase [Sphingomonadales bacterium]|nr:GNAT family N-acetyltransferase [Sphingomonadales bacterium]
MSDAAERIALRPATPADVPALAALKLVCFRETFLDGFGIPYPPADLARFEAESYGEATIAAEIADVRHATWVCEGPDGVLLAYAHAGPCKLPHPEVTDCSGELYQIYVRTGAQGLGLGRALLATSLGWLAEHYPGSLWVGVWSGNERAQAIYAAAGFCKVGDYYFMVGDHRDAEFIYRRD